MKDGRFSRTRRAIDFRKTPTRQTAYEFIQSRYAGGNNKRRRCLTQTERRSDTSSENRLNMKTQGSGR